MRMIRLLLRMVKNEKSSNFNFYGIVVCMLFIYGASVTHAASFNGTGYQAERENIFSTEICVKAATKISASMNNSIDPCQNFYEFVCGNFGRKEQLNGFGQVDHFTMIFDQVQHQIMNFVERDIDPQEPQIYKLIKAYYRSCLNRTHVEGRGLEPLRNILSRLGGWPVVVGDAWTGQNFTWQRMDQILQSFGYSPKSIFRIFVMKDAQNSSRNILYVGPSNTELQEVWHDENVLKAYEDYMIDVAVLLGADKNRAKVELDQTVTFARNLLNARYSASPETEVIVDYVKIKDLQNIYPPDQKIFRAALIIYWDIDGEPYKAE